MTINVGVIGAGRIGKVHAETVTIAFLKRA